MPTAPTDPDAVCANLINELAAGAALAAASHATAVNQVALAATCSTVGQSGTPHSAMEARRLLRWHLLNNGLACAEWLVWLLGLDQYLAPLRC
jgi:hypothetical protein